MSGPSHLAEPQLNATPLIDVLLVLLIMIIFTLPVATHAVKLNLPHGTAAAPPPAVRLDIAFDGSLFWDGSPVASVAELAPRLETLARAASPTLLRVVPEKRTRYEAVAQVLAAAQRAHVETMSVAPVADAGDPP